MEIINHTNPGQTPVHGDWIETKEGKSSVQSMYNDPGEGPEPTAEQLAQTAREWRDDELARTDFIVPLSDHPQRAAYMTYRAELRNWPTTSDFPATKPALGS